MKQKGRPNILALNTVYYIVRGTNSSLHFPDILEEMLNCNNLRADLAHGEATSSFRYIHTALYSNNLKIEVKPNITAASTIVNQRYLTATITIFQTQTLLFMKPTHSSIHPTLLQMNPAFITT